MTPVAAAIDIQVRPGDGLAGLNQALKAAREARQSNKGKAQPIRIVLAAGTYVLPQPWVITDQDAGTSSSPLLIEAERPGSAILVGAQPMNVAEVSGSRWLFKPAEGMDKQAERAGGQFYVNNARAILAREPDVGSWWFVQSPSKNLLTTTPDNAAKLGKLLAGNRDRAIVELMQSWTSGQHRVAGGGEEGGALELEPAPKWPMLMYGSSQRFFIENVPAALDSPGEWIADNDVISYLPRKQDGAAGSAQAFWPRTPTLLVIKGQDNKDHRVSNVSISGLRFAYTAVRTPPQGWVDGQAAVDVPAAIELENTADVRLTRCEVRHTGGYAVWLKAGVVNTEISHCLMDDLGAGGIKVGIPRGNEQRPTDHNNLLRNAVTNTGAVFPGAVGIWVGKSGHNLIANNIVAHTTYSGISVGWTWGYEDQLADDNQIRDNVLFDIGRRVMSDIGGIYTLGKSKGTVISGNLIRQVQDFPGYGAGAWGIYNDEGTTGVTVEGNVVVGTRSGGYHLHYGGDNVVRDNVFAGSEGKAEVRWSKADKSTPWLDKDNATASPKDADDVDLNGAALEAKSRMGLKAASGPNHERVDVRSDAAHAGDVNIQGGSKTQRAIWAAALSKANETMRTAQSELGLDANELKLPALPAVPQSPGVSWAWHFDKLPDGPAPWGIAVAPARMASLVSVTRDAASNPPTRCLLVKDGEPSLQRYEPYIYVQPATPLAPGATAMFEVRLDDASVLIHEWRDSNAPQYKTILKFSMSPQKGLSVGGRTLSSALPADEWLQVRVTVAPASSGRGTWSLDVKGAKGSTGHWDSLPLDNTGVPKFGWAGWISDTDKASSLCLKTIEIRSGR